MPASGEWGNGMMMIIIIMMMMMVGWGEREEDAID
jgi:hypothetical protein